MQAEPPPIRVVVCKADPLDELDEARSQIIEISMPFEKMVGPIDYNDDEFPRRCAEQMALDAGLIHGALLQLPQGTLDRLLILMLDREKSLLRCQLSPGKRDADAK